MRDLFECVKLVLRFLTDHRIVQKDDANRVLRSWEIQLKEGR